MLCSAARSLCSISYRVLRRITSVTRSAACSIRLSECFRSIFRLMKPNNAKNADVLATTQIASLAANPKRNDLIDLISHQNDFRLFHLRTRLSLRGRFEDREILHHRAEDRETRGYDRKRYRHLAPLRNVMRARSGFEAGGSHIQPIGDEAEQYHHGAGVQCAGAHADSGLVQQYHRHRHQCDLQSEKPGLNAVVCQQARSEES